MFIVFLFFDGEIVVVVFIVFGVMIFLFLFVFIIIYLIYKCCNKDKYVSVLEMDVMKCGDVDLEVKNGIKIIVNGNKDEKEML